MAVSSEIGMSVLSTRQYYNCSPGYHYRMPIRVPRRRIGETAAVTDKAFRVERDSMGELKVPADALWGAQTQRAVENFPISGLTLPRAFLRALGLVKWAAAEANEGLGLLPPDVAESIRGAALEVADGRCDAHFPID